jgi:hypothetical protein
MRVRFSKKATDEALVPVDQLKLVHAEVDRQRTAINARLGNMHTRAAILVTASGVYSTVQANNWTTGWQFIGIVLSIAAAVIGLLSMRPSKGTDANATLSFRERLMADSYSTEYSIVEDSMDGLRDDLARIEKAAKLIVWGYGILVLAWLAMPVTVALMSAHII